MVPRMFYKLIKPVFAFFAEKGTSKCVIIISSFLSCWKNVQDTVYLMDTLGFTFHPDKSVLMLTQTFICDYDAIMALNGDCRLNLQWWIDNLHKECNSIKRGKPDIVIHSDSSGLDWGGVNETDQRQTGGHWSIEEQKELYAVFLLACFKYSY